MDVFVFGMEMPGRIINPTEFRYGFNGKEKDDEVKGSGNSYDYGFRIYDPRAGRFLSVDPLTEDYPYYSPYQYAGNTPIQSIDVDGLEPAYQKPDGTWVAAGDQFQINPPTGTYDHLSPPNNPGAPKTIMGVVIENIVSDVLKNTIVPAVEGINSFISGKTPSGEEMGWTDYVDAAANLMAVIPSSKGKTPKLSNAKAPQVKVSTPYKRPNNATTKQQRATVQNKPCVDCGATGQKNVADHKKPLVEEYYEQEQSTKKK